MVGPDVDAAGLYVGLTRGRKQNVAITIAQSDDTAVANIAETMLRGITEVTISDSIAAARVELQRVAGERAAQRITYGGSGVAGTGLSR